MARGLSEGYFSLSATKEDSRYCRLDLLGGKERFDGNFWMSSSDAFETTVKVKLCVESPFRFAFPHETSRLEMPYSICQQLLTG